MRTLAELLETKEPAWPTVQEWIRGAKCPVEVLPTSGRQAAEVLVALQITTRAPMGAIAFETGGLLVDHGWLRILGSGGSRMEGDLARWNGMTARPIAPALDKAMIIAHDVIGGFFTLDGSLGPEKVSVGYLAPDTLELESLGIGYSQFVKWTFGGALAKFYEDFRWSGWESEVAALSCDRGYSFVPPLFTEAESFAARSRRDVPMAELLSMNLELAAQL